MLSNYIITKKNEEMESFLITLRKNLIEQKFEEFLDINYNFSQAIVVIINLLIDLCNTLLTQKVVNIDKFCKEKDYPKTFATYITTMFESGDIFKSEKEDLVEFRDEIAKKGIYRRLSKIYETNRDVKIL